MSLRPQNEILRSLPKADFANIAPQLSRVELKHGTILITPGEPVRDVFFVNTGVVSIVADLPDGVVETAIIGKEGFVGLPALLRIASTPMRAVVQTPGDAERISTKHFHQHAVCGTRLHNALLRFTHAVIVQMAYTAACNRLHRIHLRCARWLLTAHDRASSDSFPLTQEFLGQMLGIRRPQASECMQQLKRLKAIDYRHGEVTVVDRKALEQIACDCYRTTKAAHDALHK